MASNHVAPWRRHELVTVDAAAWAAVLAETSFAHPHLATWAEAEWPLIVRRRMRGDAPDRVPVGAPLPPSEGKLRIALSIPEQAITTRFSLPGLDKVRQAAPPLWNAAISALLALGDRFGGAPAVFGGLFWEYCTGLNYLSSTSDLDLLWSATPGAELSELLEGLAEVERMAPMRIDGELAFPDGRAVHWREFLSALRHGDTGDVLVKTIERAEFQPVRSLISPEAFA